MNWWCQSVRTLSSERSLNQSFQILQASSCLFSSWRLLSASFTWCSVLLWTEINSHSHGSVMCHTLWSNRVHTETTHIWLTCSPSKRYVVFMVQKVPENQMSWCKVYLKKNSLRRILSLHSHMTRIRWWCVALTRGQQVQIFTGFHSENSTCV